MKRNISCLISGFFLGLFLISGVFSQTVVAQGGPPTPEQVFDGHNFTEDYWDINVFNNSYWDHPDADPMVSWLNNTWNMKWMKEGNFEMGMLAFLNKTHWEDGKEVTFTTPGQLWWQHGHLNGSEILIASMHAAWFGFQDNAPHNGYYDSGEDVNPFFYMGSNTQDIIDTGIISNPKAIATPLQRSVNGSTVTYTWSYRYNDIVFFVPQIDHYSSVPEFNWGFNYSDPGTYVEGSNHIGNQTYIQYEYTLEVDTAIGEATLFQNYESGPISAMVYRDSYDDPWAPASLGNRWVPLDWALCLGSWSFIMAGQDYAMTDLAKGEINANVHKNGLTEVKTTLGGAHAFDFKFSQKPTYQITNVTDSTTTEHPVLYECLDVNSNSDFIDLVSGMTHLIGDFGRILVAYAANQTNHFTNGVPFEDAYDAVEPNKTAAFFITCYPKFGESGGGKIVHDPVFKAFFTPTGSQMIPGFPISTLIITLTLGIAVVLISKKRLNIIKH